MRLDGLLESIDDLIDRERAGVDPERTLGDPKRRVGSFAIESITMLDAREDLLFIDHLAARTKLAGSAMGMLAWSVLVVRLVVMRLLMLLRLLPLLRPSSCHRGARCLAVTAGIRLSRRE